MPTIMMLGGPGYKKAKPGMEEEEDVRPRPKPGLAGMGKMRAAKDAMAAMEAGDAGAFSEALEAHYAACQTEEESPKPSMDDE